MIKTAEITSVALYIGHGVKGLIVYPEGQHESIMLITEVLDRTWKNFWPTKHNRWPVPTVLLWEQGPDEHEFITAYGSDKHQCQVWAGQPDGGDKLFSRYRAIFIASDLRPWQP